VSCVARPTTGRLVPWPGRANVAQAARRAGRGVAMDA
jgi:hypothetical protein